MFSKALTAPKPPIVLLVTLIFLSLTLQPVNALTMQDFTNTSAQKEQRELNRQELLTICQNYIGSGLNLAPSLIRNSLSLKTPKIPNIPNFSTALPQLSKSLDPIISRLSAINNLLNSIKSTLQSIVSLKEKFL